MLYIDMIIVVSVQMAAMHITFCYKCTILLCLCCYNVTVPINYTVLYRNCATDIICDINKNCVLALLISKSVA